jgi:hypothetical protein
MGGVLKNRPPEIGGDAGIAGAKIEALEGFSAEEEQGGEEKEKHRNTESDARGGTFSQGERPEPERASGNEEENAGAGKIEHDPGDKDGERD